MRQSRHMRDEVSPSEYARRVGSTTRSVQRWIALGKLPARRVGGRWRVASDALDAIGSPGSPADVRVGRITFSSGQPADASSGPSIERLFIANRGEIARCDGRLAGREDRK